MFNFIKFKLMILLVAMSTVFAFAAKPKPIETDSVKVVYVVDGMENEKVKAIMPRSVLDSILQDVDSVYLAHYALVFTIILVMTYCCFRFMTRIKLMENFMEIEDRAKYAVILPIA